MERYNGVIKTAFPSVVTLHPIQILSIKVYYTILSISKLYQKNQNPIHTAPTKQPPTSTTIVFEKNGTI
jgi:hypothetical protein